MIAAPSLESAIALALSLVARAARPARIDPAEACAFHLAHEMNMAGALAPRLLRFDEAGRLASLVGVPIETRPRAPRRNHILLAWEGTPVFDIQIRVAGAAIGRIVDHPTITARFIRSAVYAEKSRLRTRDDSAMLAVREVRVMSAPIAGRGAKASSHVRLRELVSFGLLTSVAESDGALSWRLTAKGKACVRQYLCAEELASATA